MYLTETENKVDFPLNMWYVAALGKEFKDKVVVEEQFKNIKKFGAQPTFDIHVDVGPNRARRLLKKLLRASK